MEWLFEVAAAKAALTNTVFVKAYWAARRKGLSLCRVRPLTKLRGHKLGGARKRLRAQPPGAPAQRSDLADREL